MTHRKKTNSLLYKQKFVNNITTVRKTDRKGHHVTNVLARTLFSS